MPAGDRHEQACNHGDYNPTAGQGTVERVTPPS